MLLNMDKWFKDILPDKDPYHNRGRDQMREKGGPEFECLWSWPVITKKNLLTLSLFVSAIKCLTWQRGNPRFDSIFYNNAPVLKRTFACPRLKNDFPSFLSSLYVRTTNIYWRNSSLFSTTHPTFLHSCPFRRSAELQLSRSTNFCF
jgi:hypothetical protein